MNILNSFYGYAPIPSHAQIDGRRRCCISTPKMFPSDAKLLFPFLEKPIWMRVGNIRLRCFPVLK